jgi:hypothetical protein
VLWRWASEPPQPRPIDVGVDAWKFRSAALAVIMASRDLRAHHPDSFL